MKKILVTGGTGLVGAHLLYQLTKAGYNPIATKRKKSNIENTRKIFKCYSNKSNDLFEKINWVECDILDIIELEKIVQNITHIYHAAALISFNNSRKNEMIEINATGTSNIIDLALKHNVIRLCYVSSIATLGSNYNLPVNENCIWDWSNKSGYAISKYLAEMEVWRGFAEGLSGFIVNPSLIIGPGSWNSGIGTIINKAQWGMPFYPAGRCGLIDVNDLVEIMAKLMNSDVSNERFIINAEHMTYHKLMTIVSQSLNKRGPFIKLNRHFMKFFILLDVVINKIRNKRIELSVDAVKYTNSEILLNSQKINETISFSYRNIKNSLQECINIFINKDL